MSATLEIEEHHQTCERCLLIASLLNEVSPEQSAKSDRCSRFWLLPCRSRLPIQSDLSDMLIDVLAVWWLESVVYLHYAREGTRGLPQLIHESQVLHQRLEEYGTDLNEAGRRTCSPHDTVIKALMFSLATFIQCHKKNDRPTRPFAIPFPREVISSLVNSLKARALCKGRGTGCAYIARRISRVWTHIGEPDFLFVTETGGDTRALTLKDFRRVPSIDPPMFRRLWGGTINPRMPEETRAHLLAQRFDCYIKPCRRAKAAAKS